MRLFYKRKIRETFREIAMKKWLIKELLAKNHRVTKHQQREQDRSLVILSLLLSLAQHQDFGFEWHSTSFLRKLLGLTQNQMFRILKQMTTRGFLLEKKACQSKFYLVNLDNASVKRLRLTLGLTLTRKEKQQRKTMRNVLQLLKRLTKVLSNLLVSSDNRLVNTLWNNWEPQKTLQEIATWISRKIAESKSYFELIELEGRVI